MYLIQSFLLYLSVLLVFIRWNIKIDVKYSYYTIHFIIPSLPENTNFSKKYFALSKVYTNKGGLKKYT